MVDKTLHGVNLTGWLSLESWVTPELFAGSGAIAERELAASLGTERYQELVRTHRASFITAEDFRRIAARGFNAVRLVLPWFVLGEDGPGPGPYLGCLDEADAALEWAEDIGLSVIFVLGIMPGAASRDGEAGDFTGVNDLLEARNRMLDVIGTLSSRWALRSGFFGIELAEDVVPQVRRGLSLSEGVPLHVLRNYYRDAYDRVRKAAGPDPVVIIPDGGHPKLWRGFLAQSRYRNVWIDVNLTRRPTTLDAAGPSGLRRMVETSRRHLVEASKSGMPVMVGTWSSSLPIADSATTQEGRIAYERIYASEQLALLEKTRCPAWFFQTWKTSSRLASWDARIALASFERGMLA